MGLFGWLRRLTARESLSEIIAINIASESVSPPAAAQETVTWTSDMNVNLPDGRTLEELVDTLTAAINQGRDPDQLVAEAHSQFGLSIDDAELAVDRVCGGIFRASTGSPDNCPSRANDPIAWLSFQKAFKRN